MLVVGGRQLSGMSISVVTPPSAAALVALAKPSHSVRPGSLTWTCVSTSPGRSISRPGNSATSAASGESRNPATTAIRPSRTATVAGRTAAAGAACTPDELEAAMAGQPRIGERGLSAQSRQEQAGVGSDAGTIQALRDANAAYEDRFGHVFLICATGCGPDEILAELYRRLAHDPDAEREVAAAEIGKINALRLRRLAAA